MPAAVAPPRLRGADAGAPQLRGAPGRPHAGSRAAAGVRLRPSSAHSSHPRMNPLREPGRAPGRLRGRDAAPPALQAAGAMRPELKSKPQQVWGGLTTPPVSLGRMCGLRGLKEEFSALSFVPQNAPPGVLSYRTKPQSSPEFPGLGPPAGLWPSGAEWELRPRREAPPTEVKKSVGGGGDNDRGGQVARPRLPGPGGAPAYPRRSRSRPPPGRGAPLRRPAGWGEGRGREGGAADLPGGGPR